MDSSTTQPQDGSSPKALSPTGSLESSTASLPNTSLASSITTASSTTITRPKWHIFTPQLDRYGCKADAMSRKYPAPSELESLTVEEMLALPPLKGTFRYELLKDDTKEKERLLRIQENERKRRKEQMEEAKRNLRAWAGK